MTRGHKSVSKALSLFFIPLFFFEHAVSKLKFFIQVIFLLHLKGAQSFSFLMCYEWVYILYLIKNQLNWKFFPTKQYLGFGHSVHQWNTARQNSFTNETDTPFGHQKTRPYTLENTNVITILLKLATFFLWRFSLSKLLLLEKTDLSVVKLNQIFLYLQFRYTFLWDLYFLLKSQKLHQFSISLNNNFEI